MSTRSPRPSCCNMRCDSLRNRLVSRLVRARRAVLVASCAVLAACGNGSRGSVVKVTIPPGASVRTAADSLHHAGLVTWPRLFRYYAKATGKDHDIKAGTYAL